MRNWMQGGKLTQLSGVCAMLMLAACQTTTSSGGESASVQLRTVCRTLAMERQFVTRKEFNRLTRPRIDRIKLTHARYRDLQCDAVLRAGK